jgi:hypothetical protein
MAAIDLADIGTFGDWHQGILDCIPFDHFLPYVLRGLLPATAG